MNVSVLFDSYIYPDENDLTFDFWLRTAHPKPLGVAFPPPNGHTHHHLICSTNIQFDS